MKLRTLIDEALDALAARLYLHATTARTGIDIIEAAHANTFETELRAVTRNEQERADLRDAAIELGKMGLVRADLEPMAHLYSRARLFDITADDMLEFARRRLAETDQ